MERELELEWTDCWKLIGQLRGTHSREAQSHGGPQYYETDFQELNQVPTVNIREKSPHLLRSKACLQGKLVSQSLTCWDTVRPKWPGRREISTPTYSCWPVPSKWGREMWETLVKGTVQRHRLAETLTLCLKNTSLLITMSPMACLLQFLLTSTSCLAIIKTNRQNTQNNNNKNHKAYQKAKRTIWRDRASIRTKEGKDVEIMKSGI